MTTARAIQWTPNVVYALAIASGVVLSCASPGVPEEVQSTVAPAESWNGRLEGALSNDDLDPDVLAEWWTVLGDEALTSLIDDATTANLDIRTAGAQLRTARAQRALAASDGMPQVGIGGGTTGVSSGGVESSLYSAGIDASWELDLFGRIEMGIEAAEADVQAAEEARRDVLITVLAEVALNYVDLRTIESRRRIMQQNLEAQEEALRLLTLRLDAGDATQFDVDRASNDTERTRSGLPRLEQSIASSRNRLAVLLGLPPGRVDARLSGEGELPIPPVRVAVGVPAQVLRRRPDVRQAERELAAQTARVGVAIADLAPRFTLEGSIGLQSDATASLFDLASRTFQLGPRLQWSPFNGGRIKAQIEIENAQQERAMIAYDAAILIALEEVENATVAFTQEQLRLASLRRAQASAESAARLAKVRLDAEDIDLIEYLDSQRQLLGTQDEVASSQGEVIANLVRLYKALGGGWDPRSLETEGRE